MTRLPAPAWWQAKAGGASHRIKSWRPRYGLTRCGLVTDPVGFPAGGAVTAEPTRPICRVCESRRAVER